jgi:putative SOS response-associated peptidase YedK
MCGRYTSTSSIEELAKVFEVEEVRAEPLPPRYNVAPTLQVYAVAVRHRWAAPHEDQDDAAHRALGTFRWGLVPSWAKDVSVGNRMINARAESLASKPAYRAALARRRCLIPADAFYEWQRRTKADGRPAGKLPYAVRRRDGEPMALAGLWEVWRTPDDPDAQPLQSCVIVTTAANDLMAPIHDRMPVVLAPEDWDTWLDPETDPARAQRLLVPAPSEWFEAYPVSTRVNNVANDAPDLLDPLPPPP